MKKILTFLMLTTFLIISNVIAYPDDDWWDPDWKYAKIINISENSGHDLIDYQILLNIPYNSSMQNDFDDLRFTYYDSTLNQEYEIPYWIEEKIDGNYSKIWIKIPFIPSNSNAIIKMHYGNEYAESKSNGSNVFTLFDDFDDISQWKIFEKSPGSDISITNKYSKTGSTSVKIFGNSDGRAVLKRTDIPYGSYIYEIYFYDTKENLPEDQLQTFETDADESGGQAKNVGVGYFEDYNVKNYTARYGLILNNYDTKFPSTLGWHLFGIYWNGTNYFIYIDNQLVSKSPDGWEYGLLHPLRSVFGDWWIPQKSTFYWDTYKMRKFTPIEPTYTITDASQPQPPQPPIPNPTSHSLILSNSEWKNIISAAPTRLPIIVANSLNSEVEKFINEYSPDYIYTLGFSLNLNNSHEIRYEQIPELFFTNATHAIYVQSRDKAILGSNLAYYLGLPVVFEPDPKYQLVDLESKSIEEIQDMYTSKLRENGDNTNYLVIANFDKDESLLAGYLVGMRRGYIILVYGGDDVGSILEKINATAKYLGGKGLFSKSLEYKKGEPLYLAILGGNQSIPYYTFSDPGFEIFDNKDGDTLYSDVAYSDAYKDGMPDLAVGRLDGMLNSISLNLARQRLPKGNKAVLIGEYKYGKLVDAMNTFGGMGQAWFLQNFVMKGFETERIVEKRIDIPNLDGGLRKLLQTVIGLYGEYKLEKALEKLYGKIIPLLTKTDMVITAVYALLEFDWESWTNGNPILPSHLPVVDQNMNSRISGADVVGYFGLGDKYWLVPRQEERCWIDLYFLPYVNSTNFTTIDFSGFLYDDHDLSAESEIKKQVVEQGGNVLGSSGVIHDTYTTITSSFFFSSLASGKSLGESYMDMMNSHQAGQWLSIIYPSASFTKHPLLYVKDISERILFADPAYKPVSVQTKAIPVRQSFSVTPSGSFSMATEIESNHTVENKTITVFNADSYVIEQEKPLLPVFVREFILPTDSAVESVTVETDYSRERGLERNIIYNDSYYTNYTTLIIECMQELGLGNEEPSEEDEARIMGCVKGKVEPEIIYPYPNESYWYKTQQLLDGRKKVYVYVPALVYENRQMTKILEDAQITVEYDSLLEMKVEANDIPLGTDHVLKVTLLNHGTEVSGVLYVWIEGGESESWNFTESITAPETTSVSKEFAFKPKNKGLYSVKVLFDSENVTVGPRISYFEVREVDFALNKKFRPSEVRFQKKRFSPPVNSPEISIENMGILNITSVKISDSIPEGFAIPDRNSFRNVEVENKAFETDNKIPVFVFIISDEEKPHKDRNWYWPFKKKIRMLGRQYYNASVSGNTLSIATEEFYKTNFGRNLGQNDKLIVKYLMLSEKIDAPGNLTTLTSATAFSGESHSEKAITTGLMVKFTVK